MADAEIVGEPRVVLTLSVQEARDLYLHTGNSSDPGVEDVFAVLNDVLDRAGYVTGDEFD